MTTPDTSAVSPTQPDQSLYIEALRFTLLACSYYHADPSNLADFRDPRCNAVRCLVTHATRHHVPPLISWATLANLFRLPSLYSMAPFAPRGILDTLDRHPSLAAAITNDLHTLVSIAATFQPMCRDSLELLHATLHRRTPPTLHPALTNPLARISPTNPRIIANAQRPQRQPRLGPQPQ